MTGPLVLLLVAIIASLGTAAILLTNAELDVRREDRETRRAIEAERRKAAALRGPRVIKP